MSFSMPEIDASISMPESDVLMSVDMEWAVPDEPEIILDEMPVVIVETGGAAEEVETVETAEDSAEIEEDFVDGEFQEMKLE